MLLYVTPCRNANVEKVNQHRSLTKLKLIYNFKFYFNEFDFLTYTFTVPLS